MTSWVRRMKSDRTCHLRIDTLTIEAEQQGDHRADTSSRPGKQLPHTMENSTDSKCEKDYKSLVKQCFEFCSSLEDKGCKFSFSLRQGRASISCCQVKDALQPHKEPGEGHPIFVVKISDRLPSWKGRRKSFLWQMRRQKQEEQGGADLLEDKKTASSGQTVQKEDETVTMTMTAHWTWIRFHRTQESLESDLSEEDTVIEGHPVRNSKQGSRCEVCQQIIAEKMWRHYPAQCGSCWARSLALKSTFRVV